MFRTRRNHLNTPAVEKHHGGRHYHIGQLVTFNLLIIALLVETTQAATPLYHTAWPCEHGDGARHQFTELPGLNVQHATRFKVQAVDLPTQWTFPGGRTLEAPHFAFTRNRDELFVIGNSVNPSTGMATGWLARFHAADLYETPEVIWLETPGFDAGSLSAVMHSNGFIYVASGNLLFKLNSSPAVVSNPFDIFFDGRYLPEVESNINILSDGKLLVKGGWETKDGKHCSTLLLFDPGQGDAPLQHLQTIVLPELSRGRACVYAHNGGPEYVYCIGDTTVHRYEYDSSLGRLSEQPDGWRFRYMDLLNDSSPGNAPTFMDGNLFMMNNGVPAPGNWPTDPMYVLRVSLSNSEDYQKYDAPFGTPNGFSFSKMAADPQHHILFPMDARNNHIGAFEYHPHNRSLNQLWTKDYHVSAIFAGSSTSGEIYINHFRQSQQSDLLMALDIRSGANLYQVNTGSTKSSLAGFAVGYPQKANETGSVYYLGGTVLCGVSGLTTRRGALAAPATASSTTALGANYPNPFNPETWIPYELSEATMVRIQIHDSVGHLVRSLDLGWQLAGIYRSRSQAAYWDGRNDRGERVAGGVYFYSLQADGFTARRKMVIAK